MNFCSNDSRSDRSTQPVLSRQCMARQPLSSRMLMFIAAASAPVRCRLGDGAGAGAGASRGRGLALHGVAIGLQDGPKMPRGPSSLAGARCGGCSWPLRRVLHCRCGCSLAWRLRRAAISIAPASPRAGAEGVEGLEDGEGDDAVVEPKDVRLVFVFRLRQAALWPSRTELMLRRFRGCDSGCSASLSSISVSSSVSCDGQPPLGRFSSCGETRKVKCFGETSFVVRVGECDGGTAAASSRHF